MITMKKSFITAAVSVATIAALAMPAFAEVGVNASVDASVKARWEGASTTRPFDRDGRASSSTPQERMQKTEDRGEAMIGQRIDGLNKLLARIQGLKNVSDAAKASISATVQAEIADLTNLKAKIAADTSTTTLKADTQSITKAYRIYALIMPQLSILAAADRVGTIAGMMDTVVAKIQTRLAADAAASGNASVQSALADITAKVADARAQATAATTEVSTLKPDNGDQTVMASNTAALKDARSKIQTANKDLQAARKDVGTIVKVLIDDLKSMTKTSSSTSQ